jgi:hypothetical protein
MIRPADGFSSRCFSSRRWMPGGTSGELDQFEEGALKDVKHLGREGTTMPAFATIALFCTVLGLTLVGAPAGYAHESETVKLVFQRAIPNIPGKNLVAVVASVERTTEPRLHPRHTER